jgi:hypothetical protein
MLARSPPTTRGEAAAGTAAARATKTAATTANRLDLEIRIEATEPPDPGADKENNSPGCHSNGVDDAARRGLP